MQITYTPIGIIHTPFKDPAGMPIQPAAASGITGTVEMFDEFQEGLSDLNGFSHIVLVYHFHRSTGFSLSVVPFLDTEQRGVFATRAPRRPNGIGISVVELDRIEHGVLHIRNVDILDGTPLLDIKPYVSEFDAFQSTRIGWLERSRQSIPDKKSDDRFR